MYGMGVCAFVPVEGHELEVVKSIDWTVFSASIVVVEEIRYRHPLLRQKSANKTIAIRQRLGSRHAGGYVLAMTSCFPEYPVICDHYFVHPDWIDVPRLQIALQGQAKSANGRSRFPRELGGTRVIGARRHMGTERNHLCKDQAKIMARIAKDVPIGPS